MKRTKPILLFCLSLLLSAGALLYADEASERQQGDDAFALEDYAKAVEFYQSALLLAEAEKLPDQWAEDALRLGRAKLLDGNLTEARAILTEFRKRNPLRSAGTLPADLLIAEGKYDEAKKTLEALRRITTDAETRQEISYSYASALLASGDLRGALREFDALRKSSPAAPGQGEYVYTLIRMNRCDEALAELQKSSVPGKKRAFQTLRYLALLQKRELTEFRSSWEKWISQEISRPQPRILEVLLAAASLAEKQQDFPLAEKTLLEAEKFTGNEKELQEVLLRYVNVAAGRSPESVAKAAHRYAVRFPAAPDRASLQINVANLLAEKGRFSEAEQLFLSVIEERSLPLKERMAAAEAALPVTEKNKNFPLTSKLYDFLASHAETPTEKCRHYREYADFLRRWEDDAGAVKQLKLALQYAGSPQEKNGILLSLLELADAMGQTAEVRRIAAMLLEVKNEESSAAAYYALGKAAEKEKNWSSARDFYRKSAAFSKIQRTFLPARFAAAMMTRALGESREAGKEFFAFSRDFPKTPEASQALYLAIREFRKAGDKEEEKRCTALLIKEYPDSEARAAAVLQTLWERAEADLPGTIAELETLEKEFAKQPAVRQEIRLERAKLLAKNGDAKAALESLAPLLADPNARAFPESALLRGNLLFQEGKISEALSAYRQAAESHEPGLFQDTVKGRIIDCKIVLSKEGDKKALESAAEDCRELIRTSRFPAIRLQSRCKLGTIEERSGNFAAAVSACEAAVYEARAMVMKGISPDPHWCVRAVENGLRLLANFPAEEALRRGMRLLDNAASLPLQESDLNIPKMKQEFRQKISSR